MNSKIIIVRTIITSSEQMFPTEMIVSMSDHPVYVKGIRFDYGFMELAVKEGYSVLVLPIDTEQL